MTVARSSKLLLGSSLAAITLAGSAGNAMAKEPPKLPMATMLAEQEGPSQQDYVIGPMDTLKIFVWRNQELGGEFQVRPDGRITTPLITDMPAVGKTPTMLAQDIKVALGEYIRDPLVSVIVVSPQGALSQQVRIVGATEKPASIPFRANMTLLDAMIAVGGLSEFAAGNKARLIRHDRNSGKQIQYGLKINRLLKKGDIRANVNLEPGDVIIIPESTF